MDEVTSEMEFLMKRVSSVECQLRDVKEDSGKHNDLYSRLVAAPLWIIAEVEALISLPGGRASTEDSCMERALRGAGPTLPRAANRIWLDPQRLTT